MISNSQFPSRRQADHVEDGRNTEERPLERGSDRSYCVSAEGRANWKKGREAEVEEGEMAAIGPQKRVIMKEKKKYSFRSSAGFHKELGRHRQRSSGRRCGGALEQLRVSTKPKLTSHDVITQQRLPGRNAPEGDAVS